MCLCCGFVGRWLLTGVAFSVVGASCLGPVWPGGVCLGHVCVCVCMGCHLGMFVGACECLDEGTCRLEVTHSVGCVRVLGLCVCLWVCLCGSWLGAWGRPIVCMPVSGSRLYVDGGGCPSLSQPAPLLRGSQHVMCASSFAAVCMTVGMLRLPTVALTGVTFSVVGACALALSGQVVLVWVAVLACLLAPASVWVMAPAGWR
jgi:hypothetical protein